MYTRSKKKFRRRRKLSKKPRLKPKKKARRPKRAKLTKRPRPLKKLRPRIPQLRISLIVHLSLQKDQLYWYVLDPLVLLLRDLSSLKF